MENINQSFTDSNAIEKKEKNAKQIEKWFNQIEKLYITKESKTLLKKILDYMRKYSEGDEADYASFNIQLIMNNQENLDTIVDMFNKAITLFDYCVTNKHVEISMYAIDRAKQLIELYKEGNGLVYITDLRRYAVTDDEYKQSFKEAFIDVIKTYDKTITIIGANKKEEVDELFSSIPQFRDDYFEFTIEGVQPTIDEACNEIIEVASRSVEMTDEMKEQIKEYVSNTYPNNELSFPEYRKSVCKEIAFHKGVPSYEKERTLEEIFTEIDELVGLDKAKKTLNSIVDLSALKGKATDGFEIEKKKINMVFLGNYGTGKGTFAKYITELLFTLKHIRHNKLIKTDGKELTTDNTKAIIHDALGGVLLIYNANLITDTNVICTILEAMNDEEIVIIFAGRSFLMKDFLNANKEISSRIGYTFEFDDYTTKELVDIFKSLMKKSGLSVSEGATDELIRVMSENKNKEDFNNFHFVKKFYEETISKHEANTKNYTSRDLKETINQDDIITG